IRALVEQLLREVEAAVDDRDHQRRRLIAGGALIDVGAGVDERGGDVAVALAGRQVQRRQAAPVADQLGVVVLTVDAGDLRSLRSASARAGLAVAAAAPALLGAALGGQPLLLFLRERRQVLHL